jgi:EpsI family protein
MRTLFQSRNLLIVSFLVVVQGAAGYYLNARKEYVPTPAPLSTLPAVLGDWTLFKEWQIEPEVQAVLKADDTLSRYYNRAGSVQQAGLFIAFFRSQRAGVAPHSPKNCLPGNGWVAERSTIVPVDVPGRATPVEANSYVVQRGDNKSIVMYWYQSHGRTVADEYRAKFFVMADAIRHNRTDTALVRITVPVVNNEVAQAEEMARDFVRKAHGAITAVLPQ